MSNPTTNKETTTTTPAKEVEKAPAKKSPAKGKTAPAKKEPKLYDDALRVSLAIAKAQIRVLSGSILDMTAKEKAKKALAAGNTERARGQAELAKCNPDALLTACNASGVSLAKIQAALSAKASGSVTFKAPKPVLTVAELSL